MTEAATRGVLFTKVFLEISQNSQENTGVRVSFLIKAWACNFIKKETLTQVFSCEFCEISKNTFSYRTPLAAASEMKSLQGGLQNIFCPQARKQVKIITDFLLLKTCFVFIKKYL